MGEKIQEETTFPCHDYLPPGLQGCPFVKRSMAPIFKCSVRRSERICKAKRAVFSVLSTESARKWRFKRSSVQCKIRHDKPPN